MKNKEKSLLTPAAEKLVTPEEVKKINAILSPEAVRTLQGKSSKRANIVNPNRPTAIIPKTSDTAHPIFQAVEELNGDLVSQLLKQKVANPNDRNEKGLTLLHIAVLQHRSIHDTQQTIDALLEHGADINATDLMGLTPLCCAALIKNFQLAQYLLQKSARCDFPEKETSPITIAVMVDSLPIIRLLMKNGANIQRYDLVRLAAGMNDQKLLEVESLKQFLPPRRTVITLEYLIDHHVPLEPKSRKNQGELMSFLFARYFDWKNTDVLPLIKRMIISGYSLDKGKLGSRPIDYILKSQMTEWKIALIKDKLIMNKIKELLSPENLLSTLQNIVSQPGYQKSDLLNMINLLSFTDQCDLAIILINANLVDQYPAELSPTRFIRPILENLANNDCRKISVSKETAFDRIIPYLIQTCDIDSIRIFLNSGNQQEDSNLLKRIKRSMMNIEVFKSLSSEKQTIFLDFLKSYGIDSSIMKSRDEELQETIARNQKTKAHWEEFDREFAGFRQRMHCLFHPQPPITGPSKNAKDFLENPKPQIIIAPPCRPSANPNTLATPTTCYLFPAPPIRKPEALPAALPPLNAEAVRRVCEPQKVPLVPQQQVDESAKKDNSLLTQFLTPPLKPLSDVALSKVTKAQTLSPPQAQQAPSIPIVKPLPEELRQQPTRVQQPQLQLQKAPIDLTLKPIDDSLLVQFGKIK